jgi:type I restriction enzyme S subunit
MFLNFKVPLPPIDEQKEIASYLNNNLQKLDGLILTKQSLIEDLEAYKKSLIYEVVTGKRKVVA